ncbi:serine/threonine-protein kinase PknK [Sandaracinus amylolyticus]|uniref:serine/threonine-protein kinase n=1 Tax=Sandaracinus amylolyticus TaxID=927083 RepID=UPI00069CC73B|nr:serine/threonine-protein kinase [Sandaracinus amylolyticus]
MDLSLAPGHLLRGRFEITGVLGRGGMGIVYEAHDREQGTLVALKVMRDAPSAQSVYHFKREFRTLADLRHPNLVRLGELFGEGGEWFFTMERVHGVDLLTWIRGRHTSRSRPPSTPSADDTLRIELDSADAALVAEGRPSATRSIDLLGRTATPASPNGFDEHRLRHALGQLASGVAALHAAGHVHRDLKPSNVLVTPEGRVVLIDFGIARPHLGGSTATRRAIEGTVVYMAPEQATGEAVGPAADWYSIGAMLFEAITGVVPFDGPPVRVLARKAEEAPPWPSAMVPCPADLDALVVEMLAPDPGERPELASILRIAGAPVTESALREPATSVPFVGRDSELRVLRTAFEQHRRRGRPIVLRVVGESGVGKSALVRRFLEDVQHAHADVVRLTGRCYANELVPYKAWDGVIDALTRHLRRLEETRGTAQVRWLVPPSVPALVRVFPVLARVESIADLVATDGPPDLRNPERMRREAFDAFRELLRNLSREGPIIVAIDDWHWADRDSDLLFGDLATHPESPPLVLVITQRGLPTNDALSTETTTTFETAPSFQSTTVQLGRLSESETRALASELSEGGAETGALDEIVRESGGHPMFLHQLLHRLGDRDATLRLDDVIRERARALPEDARVVLELVCVAGVPLSREVIEAAAGLPRARCAAALDDLVGAQLLRARAEGGRLEPWHDRIREAVEAGLAQPVKASVHAALADALSRVAGDDDGTLELARHLAAAGHTERAAQAAEIAARRAERTLAFDRAAELYRLALELGRHDGQRELGLRLALSSALSNAGRGALEAAQGFLAAADATTDAGCALELRTRALEQLSISGHVNQALELLRRLCRDVGVTIPRSRITTAIAYLWHRTRLRMFGLPAHVDGAAPARSAAEHRLYMTAFMHLPILDPLLATWLHARTLVIALRTRDRAMLGLCLCREAGISLTFDASGLEHAMRASQLAHQLFEGDTAIEHRAWLRIGDAIRCYFSGRFQAAIALFREGESIWSEEPQQRVANASQVAVFVLGCQRYLGRVDALRRELVRLRRDAVWRGNVYLETTATLAANLGPLLQDGPDAARIELDRVSETALGRWGGNDWYRVRAEAEIDLHRGVGIPKLREHLARLAGVQRTSVGWVVTWGAEMQALEGRLWLACADHGDTSGLRRVARIAKKLGKHPLPYGPIWGGLLDAAVRLRRGDAIGGRGALEDCAVQADLHGYALYGAAARARLGELRGMVSPESRSYFVGEGVNDEDGALRVVAPGFRVAPRTFGSGETLKLKAV